MKNSTYLWNKQTNIKSGLLSKTTRLSRRQGNLLRISPSRFRDIRAILPVISNWEIPGHYRLRSRITKPQKAPHSRFTSHRRLYLWQSIIFLCVATLASFCHHRSHPLFSLSRDCAFRDPHLTSPEGLINNRNFTTQ